MNPDELVTLLSQWLARHVDDDELRRALADAEGLSPGQEQALEELRAELEDGGSEGDLERTVRETLEALALG